MKSKGTTTITMKQLDKFMKYQDNPQFDYETFKVLYDINPQLQKLIRNFDQEKIELAVDATDNLSAPQASGTDTVGQMAQRATDLG